MTTSGTTSGGREFAKQIQIERDNLSQETRLLMQNQIDRGSLSQETKQQKRARLSTSTRKGLLNQS